jgi:hypothetical protein
MITFRRLPGLGLPHPILHSALRRLRRDRDAASSFKARLPSCVVRSIRFQNAHVRV